jgi:hypothetical protein
MGTGHVRAQAVVLMLLTDMQALEELGDHRLHYDMEYGSSK